MYSVAPLISTAMHPGYIERYSWVATTFSSVGGESELKMKYGEMAKFFMVQIIVSYSNILRNARQS